MDIIFDPQMTSGDMAALETFAAKINPEIAIEVGSWKGLSTMFIAKYSQRLYCVDTWKAAENTPHMVEEAQQRDIFTLFRNNMVQLQLMDKVKPMVMTSLEAASLIMDNSADLIFIDANHAYSGISADIQAWWPKLKAGGVLCGHDCDRLYSNCNPELQQLINDHLENDFLQDAIAPGKGLHPGVSKAINDIFNDGVTILEGSSIWWRRK